MVLVLFTFCSNFNILSHYLHIYVNPGNEQKVKVLLYISNAFVNVHISCTTQCRLEMLIDLNIPPF